MAVEKKTSRSPALEDIGIQAEFIKKVAELNKDMARKYHIVTFGCQMNENDSEKIAGMLNEMGYEETGEMGESHVIVYNTCCVRENAENKVFGHLGALKIMKEKRDDLVFCVCGCMAQQDEIVKNIVEKYRHVDMILGTQNLHRFPEVLYSVLMKRNVTVAVRNTGASIVEGVPVKRKDKIKAWVTIMHGCNNFCSYCIVPYVRGRERSRRMEDIIDEVKGLAGQGYKEVTLLGQNVNSYGKDFDGNPHFAGLLYDINEINGLERIRFMTSHPRDLSVNLIHAMRDCGKVCEHLHLPLQSGSSKVLKDMNRNYTKEQYLDLISMVKENIPDIAVTTDIIVGFPGETDEDFTDTVDVVEKAEFDMAYTFIYSKRKGTKAADRTDLVPENIIKERFDSLVKIQNGISKRKNDSLLNRTVEVLAEGLSKTSHEMYTGRTRTNKVVNFAGNENLAGNLVNIKIKKALTWSLEGEVEQ